MKELSIEEKAKAYDKALERAKKWFNLEEPDSYTCIVESIFPELKESVDELTWLTKYIEEEAYSLSMDIRDDEDRIKLKNLRKSLAWLEKLGEKQQKVSTWKHWKNGIAGKGEEGKQIYLIKCGYTYNLTSCLCFECDYIELSELDKLLSEKQGEQKTIDNVEPKFKVKYAGSEYNVLDVKDIAGVTYYGIEDEPNHIDYVLPNNCEIVSEQKTIDNVEDFKKYLED